MIELELLGLHPDGDQLSLNDAEGNRYLLPITDELRAALRKDRTAVAVNEEPKPMTTREIQAHFRAGKTVAEVSELSVFPPSTLNALAAPIFAERTYTAENARTFRQGQDVGGLTLDELVTSRLIARGVDGESIVWDAVRPAGEPWILTATYDAAGVETVARWTINAKSRSVDAINDEATWLTETQIPAPTSPWRPLNTPVADAPIHTDTAEPVSEVATLARTEQPAPPMSLDDVLASLDTQRGKSRPMPSDIEFDGAHPAMSDTDNAKDATILAFPKMNAIAREASIQSAPTAPTAPSAHSATTAPSAKTPDSSDEDSQLEIPGMAKTKPEPKPEKSRKRNRPSMPSWDEIVFGSPKRD